MLRRKLTVYVEVDMDTTGKTQAEVENEFTNAALALKQTLSFRASIETWHCTVEGVEPYVTVRERNAIKP